jgi:multidrug efflux pump subunit AcrB
MHFWLDPNKLSARNLTAGDLVRAVQEQNIQVAAGVIGGPPLPAGTTKFQYTVNALGRLTDPSEFADIVIKTGQGGQITRVRDVARVELGAADYTTTYRFDGREAVGIAVFQLPGSNAIQTADAIYAKMKELKKNFPAGLDYRIPYDTTIFVRASIKDVVISMFEAVGLVVIVNAGFLSRHGGHPSCRFWPFPSR